MATIMINAITHRAACLDKSDVSADANAYDEKIDQYFDFLRATAAEHGFGFDVRNGGGPSSYSILDEKSFDEYEAAHNLMQATKDFWEWY